MRNDIIRRKLIRQLARSNEQLSWPAIYSSRELSEEVKAERQKILTELRRLPMAG